MNDANYTPILKIREMLMYFKLNLSSQSFIEENVPSLKKLLTLTTRDDIVREATIMLSDLFEKYDLDLDFNVTVEDDSENPLKYILNISIIYDDKSHMEILTIQDSRLIDNHDFYKQEIILDKEY